MKAEEMDGNASFDYNIDVLSTDDVEEEEEEADDSDDDDDGDDDDGAHPGDKNANSHHLNRWRADMSQALHNHQEQT